PSNHKYDAADYKQIDPAFGSNEDFVRLCAEAAKRGIRVIPDTSLNHVGSDSPYFNRFNNFPAGGAFDGGKINPASPYAKWFKFKPEETDPNKQFQGWAGVADLPELDKNDPSWRAYAYRDPDSVTNYWLDRGAAGWRMDVVPWVPDDFWREWRQAVKAKNADALTVAETWFDASKYLLGDMFDSTMNYIFRNAVLDYAAGKPAREAYANLELLREAYPPQALHALMNLLSTHDQARALHHFGYHDDGDAKALKLAKQRLRLAVFFQMTYPGSPTIYYGDEVGLGGGDDPFNRAPYPWADEGGQPDEALLADFKRLTQLRHDLPVLRRGSLSAPLHADKHVVVLARQLGTTWAITATNNSAVAQTVSVVVPFESGRLRDALGGDGIVVHNHRIKLTVPPLFGRVLVTP
ncbi:MAG: glycoside hydrolase family 13 protein, partial [Roseateles sp.]